MVCRSSGTVYVGQWERRIRILTKRYTMSIEIRAETRVDQLNEINRRLAEGTIDPSSARVWSDNLRWAAAL